MKPRATLIMTTYEMPRHLELVCTGILRQSARDFELVICDDGSGPETRKLIEAFSTRFNERFGRPIIHVWQEHAGFRKCRILNEGLRRSSGEILIFLDGDCVPHRDFVRDHLEQSETGRYLAGRRVELGEKFSSRLDARKIENGFLDGPSLSLIWSGMKGDSEFTNRCLRVTSPWLRERLGMNRIPDLKGCNYSVSRKDLEAVNGFDEAYEGYGREDTDIELRLQHLGLKIKSLKGLALQYHVWHPRRSFTPANDNRLEELKASRRIRCANGLVKE
jgi:glycosyltransferase involved in cell wall biosynthesis